MILYGSYMILLQTYKLFHNRKMSDRSFLYSSLTNNFLCLFHSLGVDSPMPSCKTHSGFIDTLHGQLNCSIQNQHAEEKFLLLKVLFDALGCFQCFFDTYHG